MIVTFHVKHELLTISLGTHFPGGRITRNISKEHIFRIPKFKQIFAVFFLSFLIFLSETISPDVSNPLKNKKNEKEGKF